MKATSQESIEKIPVPDAHNDRNIAILAHLGGILFGFIPALVIWLLKKDDKNAVYVANQAKEALNFQITVGIALFICVLLVFVIIGALLIWLVWLADIICCILAAAKTSKGENFRYPLTIRLIK